MKNSLLLIGGAVISVILLVMPAQIFECLYYDTEFSNEMYNNHLYMPNALITVLVAWGVSGLFYYVVNSVSFSRWYHWLTMLAAAMLVTAVAGYSYTTGVMEKMQIDFSVQAFHFALYEALVEAVLFVVASFAMRWWSTNCRHTPFPE